MRILCISLFLCILIKNSNQMSFRLLRNSQICIGIPSPNIYDFEYFVSGQNQINVKCEFYSTPEHIIESIEYQDHYQTLINVTNNQSKICFSSLDSYSKSISFDLTPLSDLSRGIIAESDMSKLSQGIDGLYRMMMKVYQNLHYYYQRNRTQKKILSELQLKLKLIKGWKIILILICGISQYFFIKKLIDKKNTSKSSSIYTEKI